MELAGDRLATGLGAPTSRKWVIYATFDAAGSPSSSAVEQLAAYRAQGFDTLVVDASPQLSPVRARDWDRSSTCWLRRANEGYDFGSYKRGLEVLVQLSAIPANELSVLLTNDSCYGPYIPIKPIFDRFDAFPHDRQRVFGITESHELGRHLQSYFMYFRPDVMPLALQFFAQLPEFSGREAAIEHGELGLSKFLDRRHCELVPLWPNDRLLAHFIGFRPSRLLAVLELGYRRYRRRPRYTTSGDKACIRNFLEMPAVFNATLAFGTHMFFQGLTPFVKRELIRSNPNDDPFVPEPGQFQQLDNAGVARVLRSTPQYRRRYGASAAKR